MRPRGFGWLAVTAIAVTMTATPARAQEMAAGRPFGPVVERIVEGDLLLAGNSNLGSDVDGDETTVCTFRAGAPSRRAICADNSSSAEVALPAGSRVIAARLYVETTLVSTARPFRVSVDGPAEGWSYLPLSASAPVGPPSGTSPVVPKLYEATGGSGSGAVMRQAVWDLTAYVAAAGAGTYTVADIVSQRVGPDRRHSAWAVVVAYERDPAVASADPQFAPRLVSWHDGFQYLTAGTLDVPVRGLPAGGGPFAKSFHVVAGGGPGRSDNLLFAGRPLGNSSTPGDAPLGTDAPCNALTDVQNGTICRLGTAVGTGHGVDMDVIRIPDAALRAAGPEPVVRVQLTGGDTFAPGVIAVSVDLRGGAP